jgi:hypothetical protein
MSAFIHERGNESLASLIDYHDWGLTAAESCPNKIGIPDRTIPVPC